MGSIVTLVIYAALAAGALFAVHSAWTGFKDHVAAPYVQAQIASDQKVVTKANEGQAAAEGERDHAKEDTKACVAMSETQTKAVDKSDKLAKAAIAESAAIRKQQMKDATAKADYINGLQAKAAAAPMLMACSIELDKAKNILRDQLRQKRGIVAVPVVAPAVEPPPGLVK